MGIENMRRWPMYIVFAACFVLMISLFNSWTIETELRIKISEMSVQLQECSKQQSSCMEESLTLLEQRDGYIVKINELDKDKVKLNDNIADMDRKLNKKETQYNRSQVDADLCKTELQSLKSLQISQSATLDTFRLEKETLTADLEEKKQKIEELEKEIQKLKLVIDTKTPANPPALPKVTPAAPAKLSSAIVIGSPVIEPIVENNAKEDLGDVNPNESENFEDGNLKR